MTENLSYKIGLGVGTTAEERLIRRDAPNRFDRMTVQQAIDFILADENLVGEEGQLAENVRHTLSLRGRLGRRNFAITVNGERTGPRDALSGYASRASVQTLGGIQYRAVNIRVAKVQGGGSYR